MAGAGKKTFVAGEVLTAAQVNDYLMDQSVMRFSGSAARAASITAPSEGMVTYLDDVNRIEIYDGSAWQQVPTDQDDVRNLITSSGQVLVGAGNASLIALGGATEGQVLTSASAEPGGFAWRTPEGAGAAVYKNIAATGVTALPAVLTPGFYRISTGNSTSWTQAQFRFVAADGSLYGASIASGTGFFTLPVAAASVDITANPGFNLLAEEIPGISDTLPEPPTVTDFEWTTIYGGSIAFTTGITPSRVGYFDVNGSLIASSVVTSPFANASLTASTASFGSNHSFVFVQQSADGLWSTTASQYSASALDTPYPFQYFTANGTYTPPSWSTAVDALIVAGGGGGGGAATGTSQGGGGGGGGASVLSNLATPASVAITIGGAGAAGTTTSRGGNGTATTFGSASVAGGGGGGYGGGTTPGTADGLAGGSGGGAASRFSSPPSGAVGTGISGQGFDGGTANPAVYRGGGGGGAGEVGNANGQGAGGDGTSFYGAFYGGGGGAGYLNLPAGAPAGGAGGGGAGGSQNTLPVAGAVNTGGGGGAAGTNNPSGNRAGAAGGTGIVVIRARS